MDQAHLIAEVMARTGVKFSPDDPALAMVELNKLAFEELIERIGERLDPLAERIDKAARLAAAELSRATLRNVAEETRHARATIAAEADAARLAAAAAIRNVASSYSAETGLRSVVIGGALALALVLAGFAAGYVIASLRAAERPDRSTAIERRRVLTSAHLPQVRADPETCKSPYCCVPR